MSESLTRKERGMTEQLVRDLLALHRKIQQPYVEFERFVCSHCAKPDEPIGIYWGNVTWPCATVRILRAHQLC
jgi:hypothetical protein